MAVQNFKVRNSIDILGNSLNTTSTTFNLVDSTVTTLNIGGAATNINIGATTGTLTIDNPTVVGAAATQNLFNTVATTLNIGGAATSLNLGSTTGTITINNPTIVGSQTTQNVYNTVATIVNAFGAATTLSVGNSAGTMTLRPGTVVGSNTTQTLYNTVATTVNAFGVAETILIGANNAGTTTIRTATTAVQNALTVGSTATVTTSTTSPIIQGSTANSGTLTIRSTSSATKPTGGVLFTDAIASTSTTTGTVVVTGGVGISGNLNVGGDITADGDIFIKAKDGSGGTITLGQGADDALNIQADISSNLLPDGAAQDIGSSTKKWRDIFISRNADLTTLLVSGNSTLTGDLTVNGNTTIGNASGDTLTVTATPTISAATQINNTLAVTGAVTLSGASPTITNATAGSTASIFNTTVPTINIGGAATSITIGATGVGSGTTTVRNNFTVSGTTNVQDLNVNGILNLASQPSWTAKVINLYDVSPSTDAAADAGGVVLKGTTNHSILWYDATDAWTSTEHFDLATGKQYRINGTSVLTSTTLGSGVTSSSLTSLGTLTSLTSSGVVSITNNTTRTIPTGATIPTLAGALQVTGGAHIGENFIVNGDLKVYGAAVYQGGIDYQGTQTYSGKIRQTNTTDATSSTDQNASISTDGGVAIAKKLFVGGTSTFTGAITATGGVSGNASTATALQTARTINGASFDGTSNISFSTTAVSEGTNLYYTDERVDDRVGLLISGGTGITASYDDNNNLLGLSVDFTEFSTTNVTEGTNLYYTNERVDDRVDALITAGTGIQKLYDDTLNTYTLALDFTEFNTSNITENTNLYFTTSRARTSISVSGSLSYDSATGVISYTTPTTSGITEGTNLYYTDERVDDRVNDLIIAGTGIQKTYDDTLNTYTLALDFTEFNTSNITENTNLYYTTTRANTDIDARVTKTFVENLAISYTSLSDKPTDNFAAAPYTTNHVTANSNQYISGDVVYYNGNIYKAKATNDSILPTNTTYWDDLGAGTRIQLDYLDLQNKPTLFSGSYDDLTNKPTIPTSGVDFDPVGTDNSTDVTLSGTYDYITITGQVITVGQVDATTDISGLSTVATSGDYDDLTNKPTAFTADRLSNTAAPASATSTGTAGEIRYDSDYVYICIATDTWKRAALSTW